MRKATHIKVLFILFYFLIGCSKEDVDKATPTGSTSGLNIPETSIAKLETEADLEPLD